jgi:phosphate transport system substrate-binding protein
MAIGAPSGRLANAVVFSAALAAVLVVGAIGSVGPAAQPAGAVTPAAIAGSGSSYAAPAVIEWSDSVAQPPFNLTANYTPSNSFEGRYEFSNNTIDFAVSDTTYANGVVGTTPPAFPYASIPFVGAGVAFMYNIPGLTQTLQLTSETACLVMTGQVTNWDDPVFHANGANAGVTLPNLPILPVTESDPAGTNYAMEEYCIDEQPEVWAQYAQNESSFPPPSGVPISATTPGAS